jgi:hypothetical protein
VGNIGFRNADSGTTTLAPATGALGTGTVTLPLSGTLATLEGANTFTGANVNSTAGAASLPAMRFTGVPFAGTGTTSFPLVYIADANATASTTLSTAGTYFGVNGDGTQDLMNLLKDGVSQFKVSSSGNIVINGGISGISGNLACVINNGNWDINNTGGTGAATRIYGTTTVTLRVSGNDTALVQTSAGTALNGTLAVTGNTTLGAGTAIKNIRHGVSGAMVLGVVTVTDTGCTANTRYFFTQLTQGTVTAPSAYWASTRTASTSFVITSNQLTETGTVHWTAIEP